MVNHLILGSGVSSCKTFKDLFAVCCTAMQHGITSFDTAPSYKTEEILSQVLKEVVSVIGIHREDYSIQTKIDPIQMYNGKVEEYFQNKLKIMQLEYVDALLIHWPLLQYLEKTWEELLRIKEKGYAKKIGICNLRLSHLKELKDIGVVPEILQIERHPLNTFDEELKFCQINSIQVQDYSPLCKMHPKIKENLELIKISQKYNRNIGQIVLRWHLETGASPIFTSTRSHRISEYAKIYDFSLTKEECLKISAINCNHKMYLESLICPGF